MKNKSKKNKMIKLISPYNGNVFNIELKGDEESLRDLLSIILNIPSKSIKGIKDNYNNYYTLSSALKSQNINKGPNNIFSVIIKLPCRSGIPALRKQLTAQRALK